MAIKFRRLHACAPVVLAYLLGCGKVSGDSGAGDVSVTIAVGPGAGAGLVQDAATVTDVRLCFKRLRLKADDTDDDTGAANVDFDIGEVTLGSDAQSLGDVVVPAGSYRRIDVDLEKKCSGASVRLTNAHGTFQTDDHVKIKFRGEFVASAAVDRITLITDSIVASLATVTAGAEIRAAIGDPSGIAKNP